MLWLAVRPSMGALPAWLGEDGETPNLPGRPSAAAGWATAEEKSDLLAGTSLRKDAKIWLS
jgi:hypothetical protein